MKQTDKQFMALVGHDIFLMNIWGISGKARVDAFIRNGDHRSLRLILGREQNYRSIVVSERALGSKGYIIKPMRYVEGDFKDG